MLNYFFDWLTTNFDIPGGNLFHYISFRAAVAVLISLFISMIMGGRIINYLRKKQVGETVRDLGLKGQKEKEGTPTMGGIIIIMALLIPFILLAKLDNVYVWLMIFTVVVMGLVGFADDYIKVFRKNKKGLHGKFKIAGQILIGLVVSVVMIRSSQVVIRMDKDLAMAGGYKIVKDVGYNEVKNADMVHVKSSLTNVPFFKGNRLDYGSILTDNRDQYPLWAAIIFIPLVIFVVAAISNAANLTDGLDGLAAGTSSIIGTVLAILAYISGNTMFADYLNVLYIPHSEELVIFAACFVGACIGFLWYNAYPAKVFMGDTGSLTIGASIAVMAILLRKELLLPIVCGIFVAENFSVVLQVAYFKYTKRKYGEGRRIFKMSPLHHHYQKLGMHESKIAARFWIIGVLLAVVALITLKIR